MCNTEINIARGKKWDKTILCEMHKKGREKPAEGSKLSSFLTVNGLRQKVQKTGIFLAESRIAVIMRTRYTAPKSSCGIATK